MQMEVRAIESPEAAELFITASPQGNLQPMQGAEAIFSAIKEVLKESDARILQERVFATQGAMDVVAPARGEAYGDLDDGVPPAWLTHPIGVSGQFAGVQVHAVRSKQRLQTLRAEGTACGRLLPNSHGFVALTGLSGRTGTAPEQAHAMLRMAELALRQAKGDMFCVARTWMWLEDILSWYGDFNHVRTEFYKEHRLVTGDPEKDRLPASTGIGVKPAYGPKCAMDLVAVTGPRRSLQYLLAGGDQRSAFRYGSAFSRASQVSSPGGKTVYVSGTAAIDAKGKTQHVGNIPAQIQATIHHVRAVLKDMNCTDQDVVQSIIYSKTPQVEEAFCRLWGDLPWPKLLLIADVCRENLLFEIEATACPGARKL